MRGKQEQNRAPDTSEGGNLPRRFGARLFPPGWRLRRRALPVAFPAVELGTAFTTDSALARALDRITRTAVLSVEATLGYVLLTDLRGVKLSAEVAVARGGAYAFPRERVFGEGPEGLAARTAQPRLWHSRSADPAPDLEAETALCMPLVAAGAEEGEERRAIGVLTVAHHQQGRRFHESDLIALRTLADMAALAVINARLHTQYQAILLQTLQEIAHRIDNQNPDTMGHSYRVSEVCVMVARKLRLEPQTIGVLRNGALLHEIGKIGIPEAILNKPGRLTAEELELVKAYPIVGYELCKPLGNEDGLLTLIRNHGERLDGAGYPDGLGQGDIPLPLRILSVADAFDTMCSYRPYRRVMDKNERNEQLNRFAGAQFDPIVVEALKAMLNAGELDELYREQWRPRDATLQTVDTHYNIAA